MVSNLNIQMWTIPAHQVAIVSSTQIIYSALAKHQWVHGVECESVHFKNDMVFPLILGGFPQSKAFQAVVAENASPEDIANFATKYPTQHACLSRDRNLYYLELDGYTETTDFSPSAEASDEEASDEELSE
jgi:hypothetical protein